MEALEIINHGKAVNNVDPRVTLSKGSNLDEVLATAILIWCVIGRHNDNLQFNIEILSEFDPVHIIKLVKANIVHGVIILFALGDSLSKEMLDIDSGIVYHVIDEHKLAIFHSTLLLCFY